MSCGHKDRGESCVCEVLRAIKDIQDNAVDDDCLECTTNCFLEPLGNLAAPTRRPNADTRVFTLTLKDGDLFKGLYRRNFRDECISGKSVFFRVEDVFDNCCATLRVLVAVDLEKHCDHKGDLCDIDTFIRTNNCITVDLSCFCAVQCIADVDLDICD
ncbi:CotY/CotZ family spore coat protein [Bacillus sp. 2205SS5-2]|uniref:CotY/CotZ family spore coat protein n=1 Tax=Bacillus sp. 2205SS5-2 TaxID=3109031 RepID=UPI003003BE6C